MGPGGPISESSIFQNSSEFSEFSEFLDAQIFIRILDAQKSRCVFNWFPCIAFHTAFSLIFSRNRYQPRFFSRNRYQPRNPKKPENPSGFLGVPLKIRISKRVHQNFSLPPSLFLGKVLFLAEFLCQLFFKQWRTLTVRLLFRISKRLSTSMFSRGGYMI